MARAALLLFLLLICVSDISVQDSYERTFSEEINMELPFTGVAVIDESEMCKPTGVETVTFTEGKTEPAPEKKKAVVKTTKKKTAKKVRPKNA